MLTTTPYIQLAEKLRGSVVIPTDPDWDETRHGFNLTIDPQPEAIVLPADEFDVKAAVEFARDSGFRVAPQATGHNPGPLGDLSGTILVDVRNLQEVSIDPAARRVRVGSGVKWERVVPELSEAGLAALHGSSPDVGIAGYSLGGGMGWLARKYGLQANSVTALELVTADGEFRRVDHTIGSDLFWALRGGNGNFGVVTSIEFEVYPLEELYAGVMFFPLESAREILSIWTELSPTLPDEMMTWVKLMQFPDMPDVPDEMRGRSFTLVFGAFLGPEDEGRQLLDPLRRLGPVEDTFGMVPPEVLGDMAMDPPDPLPYISGTALLDELPAEATDELVAVAGAGTDSPLTMVEFRQLGGALERTPEGAGAVTGMPGEFVMFSLGVPMDEESALAIRERLDQIAEVLRPFHSGDYPNFIEKPSDASSFFDADRWQRLRRAKAAYDPGDLFKGNHHIPPA